MYFLFDQIWSEFEFMLLDSRLVFFMFFIFFVHLIHLVQVFFSFYVFGKFNMFFSFSFVFRSNQSFWFGLWTNQRIPINLVGSTQLGLLIKQSRSKNLYPAWFTIFFVKGLFVNGVAGKQHLGFILFCFITIF
jgi:hypothetical protein